MGGNFRHRRPIRGHQSPLHDGRHYDAAHAWLKADLDFWREQIACSGDPVLELACGTGRITIPLAKAGAKITGIDTQSSMLDQAAGKARTADAVVTWVQADMRDFVLGTRFAAILLPFNGLCLMHTPEDMERLSSCVRDHLRPDGHFIVDVSSPRLDLLAEAASVEPPVAQYRFDDVDGSGEIVATHKRSYDRASQILSTDISYRFPGGAIVSDRLQMRMYFPQELRSLLACHGFRVVRAYGNYDGGPLVSDSPKQLLVCKLLLPRRARAVTSTS